MRRVDDPVTDAEQALLDLIYDGYRTGRGEWPTWQFVRTELVRRGVDAEQLLRFLPTWEHYYRHVWSTAHFPPTEDGDRLALSVAGMCRLTADGHPERVRAFLSTLAIAAEEIANIEVLPTAVISHTMAGEQLTRRVNKQAGSALTSAQLQEVLSREPSTWRAVRNLPDGWAFDMLDSILWRFLRARDAPTYLAELELMIGLPNPIEDYPTIDSLALPDALDHLDLAWRLVTTKPLLVLPRASLGAKLALEVDTQVEFDSALSALADVLGAFKIEGTGPSLQRLKSELERLLPGSAAIATDATDELRKIVAVRAGLQHHDADERASSARAALGLDRFGRDWSAMWNQVRGAAVSALRTIREQIEPLITS